jgi:hypothetical protein
VLFEQRFWAGLADGSVTMTFRRWKRAQVVSGRRYRTAAGMLEVDDVAIIAVASITDADARRSGYADAAALRADLRGDGESAYRIAFHHVGDDPRSALAADDTLDDDTRAGLDARLTRLDRKGPWTTATLALIGRKPGVRAADLAEELGRERDEFKLDVRKLKGLGLTESLEVGYRLSPRGRTYLGDRHEGETP